MAKTSIDNTTLQKRAKVPGNSLKEKFFNLYKNNPEAVAEEYMRKLDITKDQVYGLRHSCKADIQAFNERRAQKAEKAEMEAKRAELLASTAEASEALKDYQESRDRRAYYEGQPSTPINGLPAPQAGESHLPDDPADALPWDIAPPAKQPELDFWDQQPAYTTVAPEPTQQATQATQQVTQATQPPTQEVAVHTATNAVQEIVEPTAVYNINLSGVDGTTIKSFMSLLGDKVKANNAYRLKIELIEE